MQIKILVRNMLLSVLLVSCSVDNFLDVVPTGEVIPESVNDFDKLLNDYVTSNPACVNVTLMDPDVYCPDEFYDNLGVALLQKQYTWDTAPWSQNEDDLDWNFRYTPIYVDNYILEHIADADLGPSMLETDRNRVKAQALGNRAFDYFLLVNEFGPSYSEANKNELSVPLNISATLNQQLPRATVQEVYKQMEQDLDEAIALYVNQPAIIEEANFRPGMASLYGLKAWIALEKGEFELTKTYADKALALYAYLYDYTQVENKEPGDPASGVEMHEWEYSTDNKSVIWNRMHRIGYSDPVQLIHPDLVALFDQDNDKRFTLFASNFTYYGTDVSPNFAYVREDAETQAGITTADLLLMSAEAYARLKQPDMALERLNQLLKNRIVDFEPYNAVDFATADEILQLVKTERRKEFMCTGKHWFDLKRYHAYGEEIPTFTREVYGVTHELKPGSEQYIVPIATKIINLNPNLQ